MDELDNPLEPEDQAETMKNFSDTMHFSFRTNDFGADPLLGRLVRESLKSTNSYYEIEKVKNLKKSKLSTSTKVTGKGRKLSQCEDDVFAALSPIGSPSKFGQYSPISPSSFHLLCELLQPT